MYELYIKGFFYMDMHESFPNYDHDTNELSDLCLVVFACYMKFTFLNQTRNRL